jgi:hypothetical protein
MPVNRIYHCLYCWAPLDQHSRGRPRRICRSPACRRAADAERRRILRRRKAGLQSVSRRAAEPLRRGGRDPLVRRLARQLALEVWPSVVPSSADLDDLAVAIQAGLESARKIRDALRKDAAPLPQSVWETLVRLTRQASLNQSDQDHELVRAVYEDAGLVIDPHTGAWVRRRQLSRAPGTAQSRFPRLFGLRRSCARLNSMSAPN